MENVQTGSRVSHANSPLITSSRKLWKLLLREVKNVLYVHRWVLFSYLGPAWPCTQASILAGTQPEA